MDPRTTIEAFDAFLAERRLRLEAVVIGGTPLETIEPWLSEQDGNPDWPRHTQGVLEDLRRRLGHGL